MSIRPDTVFSFSSGRNGIIKRKYRNTALWFIGGLSASSVSRMGGKTQFSICRAVGGGLRLSCHRQREGLITEEPLGCCLGLGGTEQRWRAHAIAEAGAIREGEVYPLLGNPTATKSPFSFHQYLWEPFYKPPNLVPHTPIVIHGLFLRLGAGRQRGWIIESKMQYT